jgi:putative transposase
MSREAHVRFCEGLRVKLPRSTHPYIRLERGFVYLTAVIDWYSRKVLSWRLSNTLDSSFCVDCLEEALQKCGTPEIFNTDQGCQFTSEAFTSVLLAQEIRISMDGRGRALDNIFVERLWRSLKYEDIYLKSYSGVPELMLGLTEYFWFYNTERMHQSLSNRTPTDVYQTASGGGAMIVDKYSLIEKSQAEIGKDSGQRRAAARPATILNPAPFCLD